MNTSADRHPDRVESSVAVPRGSWQEAFVLELRLIGWSGAGIGDALATVEQHCADSGEDPESAFGDGADYARTLTDAAGERDEPWRPGAREVLSLEPPRVTVAEWMTVGLIPAGTVLLAGMTWAVLRG